MRGSGTLGELERGEIFADNYLMAVSKKVRVYDLARELKQDTKRIIEDLRREGSDVNVPSNSVPKELADKVRLLAYHGVGIVGIDRDHDKFKAYFHGMLERGIYLPPSGYEANFVSMAHSADDIERTIEAAKAVLSAL